MKKILGLDLGTASIGWALVNEAESSEERSSIYKLGVRAITFDNFTNSEGKEVKGNPADFFAAGKSVSPNAARTQARGMRRNLQRYKLRRNFLRKILLEADWIDNDTILSETGNYSTFQTLNLRSKAVTDEITLEEFARVLLNLNKKRGYKSSRKAGSQEEGNIVDGISIAKELYDKDLTPGLLVYRRILDGRFSIPDFYRSDLQNEFDRIWEVQKGFHPDMLDENLKDALNEKNKSQTWVECQKVWKIVGLKRDFKGKELLKENYEWRAKAVKEKISLEQLAVVLQEINGQIKNTSGYLGSISERSKELYFKNMTVGQWQLQWIQNDPHHSLKNQVFFRQDYMDEFERIWATQASFHPELTEQLKKEIRDVVIFYQRPLKSQKGLISLCEFESWDKTIEIEGKKKTKRVGLKVCPKSSPLFQEFKIWQRLNDLKVNGEYLDQDSKETLFAELSIRGRLSDKEVLKILFKNHKELSLNFKEVEGNNTQASLYKAYSRIIAVNGYDEYDFSKMSASDSQHIVSEIFTILGYRTDFLSFDSSMPDDAFEKQPMFRLWHLLYSYEGDKSISGNEKLISKIIEITGMDKDSARILAGVTFPSDYGSLSSKAMRKILEHMREGNEYSLACEYAGYRHSAKSLTKEEIENKVYKECLTLIPRNSLRNPVVEKILNQMVNVVNEVIKVYGKPDEVRIELARELKKSATERKEMADAIAKSTKENEQYRDILKKEFGVENPGRNDIIRYRLYLELKDNGFHTLYSNTYIPQEKLFSKEFDIEHIIPQAKLFDDSFSNKTLESRSINIEKSNKTAFDFINEKYNEEHLAEYESKVEHLYKIKAISRTKRNKLLMKEADIPQGFIERDLRETQYIAKKAKEMLEDVIGSVVPTTGSITDRLREDWQLVDIMKELNWDKYDKLGMTNIRQDKDGRRIYEIKDWTKRNDHRHHAMDALTIAFTKRSFIQYLNNLNARINKGVEDSKYIDLKDFNLNDLPQSQRAAAVRAIEKNQMYRDSRSRLRFMPPMPLDEFRKEAKRHLEDILISIKAKNKVATRNVNISKKKGGVNKKVQLTPRGQLHNETIYGRIKQAVFKEEKVGPSFTAEKIATVASVQYRNALLRRLAEFGNDPKKAFGGKNTLEKNPVFIDEIHSEEVPAKVKTMRYEEIYTKRESITPDLKIDKVIDRQVKRILEARLKEFGGDPKKAFVNLDENPIWLNREKGIRIKKVTITGKSNAVPLHSKNDKEGKYIMNSDGEFIPNDYVSTGSNHHVAIYKDGNDNLQEQVVSFLDAVTRVNLGIPVIDRDFNKEEGWKFMFTMKQNEYFAFPNPSTGFDPNEIDLMDPENYSIISPNLFRVQKLASDYYVFRHHLETTVNNNSNELRNITWERIQNPNGLKGIVKVRINHLGKIVQVGE